MFKIELSALAICVSTLAAFSQPTDTSRYENRRLKFEEANLVVSYYKQDGDNSAVTGGIGSEHLTDFATTIDVRLSKFDGRHRKHVFTADVGIDVYSSASSDKIDPATISSASSGDKRIYPSLTYSIENEERKSAISINASISTEFDYFSKGLSLGWTKLSRDRNREFSAKAQVYLDTWKVILPIELRDASSPHGNKPRDSYSTSLALSQVVSKRLQVLLMADVAFQSGQLATLYQRTYFADGSHRVENLPDRRLKIPIGLRVNYFAGDNIILRTYYRYYADSWGMTAHTAELELPVKIMPFFSLSPFYRYSTQQGIRYFAAYQEHATSEEYYTSDYDLSTLSSNTFGLGLRYAPPGGVFKIVHLGAMEFRYSHYDRSTGLKADIITMLIKIK